MEDLLEEALLRLPRGRLFSEYSHEYRRAKFGNLDAQFSEFREFLLCCTEKERARLWERANERLQLFGRVQNADPIGLAFFSHPTPQIFEEFLKDETVWSAFCEYLKLLSQSSFSNTGRHRKKKLREVTSSAVYKTDLVAKYTELIERHGGEFHGLRTHKTEGSVSISLVESVAFDFPSFEKAVDEALRRSMLEKLQRLYSRAPVEELLQRITGSIPAIEELVDEYLLYADIGDLEYVVPEKGVRPLTSFSFRLTSVMKKNVWPIFHSIRLESKARIKKASVIRCEFDEESLSTRCHSRLQSHLFLETHDGLLSVGLKLHSLTDENLNGPKLGGFKIDSAEYCAVLPPVGNATAAVELVRMIERHNGLSIFHNPAIQIQVCTPGVVSAKNAAILGIVSYLGSDVLRRYELSAFQTNQLGTQRPIIPGGGVLDANFEWWEQTRVCSNLPFQFKSRSDVLACTSEQDIRNVNLAASLLVHAQSSDGYWQKLGLEFIERVTELCVQHQLEQILDIDWRWTAETYQQIGVEDEPLFLQGLNELMSYAFDEAGRVKRAEERGDHEEARSGILFEIKELLAEFRTRVETTAKRPE
ncbi:MAG: hypothetical protein ABA06_00745 [Parcubacteria bacterium C7867-001]|nr:MAG: hypothetical protein ABA06_00745 [Parcubacteria bacterium C7867-001]